MAAKGVFRLGFWEDVTSSCTASAVSVMLDPLLGTVFHTAFTKSMTLVFLSVA